MDLLQAYTLTYGIGKKRIYFLKQYFGCSPYLIKKKIKYINYVKIKNKFKFVLYGKELRKNIKKKLLVLQKLKTYKGFRHTFKLPVRGQRTHTNAKTQKKKKYLSE